MSAENNKDCIVLVPVSHHIEPDCDASLRMLERMGYHVWRAYGFSAIDQGRNVMAQQSLDKGYKELMWIDADVVFQTSDVNKLRDLKLPISCGIYGLKDGSGRPAADLSGKKKLQGPLYEIPAVGAGFLHTRREVYEAMIKHHGLQKCVGRHTNYYPFFLPAIRDNCYLGEDFAFCRRARDCGFTVVADTSIKLKHVGKTTYHWSTNGPAVDNLEHTTPPPEPTDPLDVEFKDDIAAVTCFFNPAGFKTNLLNFRQFKTYMKEIGCPLYSVELAFGDRPFELEPDEFTWQIRTNDVLWHKERLINLMEKRVPARYTKIIWTDSDLYWPDDPDWYQQTSLALNWAKIVQPFSDARYLTEERAIEFIKRGTVWAKKAGKNAFDFYQYHPGFVWAAQREFFTKFGLYDRQVVGSGDSLMALALLGQPRAVLEKYAHVSDTCPHVLADFLEWATPVSQWVGGEITYIDTVVEHRWHGKLSDRKYHERLAYVKKLLPARDLVPNADGVFCWGPQVPEDVRNKIASYFAVRQEDQVEVCGNRTGIITGVDAQFFPAFQWWWEAVKRYGCGLESLVFDFGLTAEQKTWMIRNGVNFAPMNPYGFDGPNRKEYIGRWTKTELCWLAKPFLLKNSKFDTNLWIDVDALLINSIQPLLDQLAKGPVVCADTFNPEYAKNKKELYTKLPIGGLPTDLVINAGVVGMNPHRDREVYDWWLHCIYKMMLDEELRPLVSCADQGALLWAIHRSRRYDMVMPDRTFNCPANFQSSEGVRKDYSKVGHCFLEAVKKDHPCTAIVHWLGSKKFDTWPKFEAAEDRLGQIFKERNQSLSYEI